MSPESAPAANVRWDLRDLYESPDDPALREDEKTALRLAEDFARRYRGSINVEGGPSPDLVASALTEYEELLDKTYKPFTYARLLHSVDSRDPDRGALVARTQELATRVQTTVMFFELDWIALAEEVARRIIESPACSRWGHFLTVARQYRPHTLSEAEEIVFTEKATTGVEAFRRLFDEVTSSHSFEILLDGEKKTLTQSEALALLHGPDREKRRAAHAGFTRGLHEISHLATFIYNTTVQDHAVNSRLRKFSDPSDSRHLANQIDRETVEILLTTCEKRAPLVHEYYGLKRRLLGLDRLFDYDRYAPVEIEGVSLPTCDWDQAIELIQSAYHDFSPQLGAIVREFADRRWIDAEPRPGKRGGAYCHSTVPSVHPYIMVNFNGRLTDVMTLAHELGHGVHQYLSRPQGILQSNTPLTVAETASVFGEMLVFDRLLRKQNDPKVKLSLLCHKLEDSFATVFRQGILTRFEQRVHAARAEKELSTEELDQLWMEANQPMHGDSVELTPEYRRWWSYVSHFIHTPFYCYSYSFGELLVLALWSQFKREGSSFIPKYLGVLAAGGSDSPANLVARLGLDIKDPDFWNSGLSIVEEILREAKELADEI